MLIAIDSNNEDLAGAIVYWRLSGAVNGEDLNAALTERGLDDHTLGLPTPKRALRRTLQEYARGEVFLRAGKGKDGGLYLVRQSVADTAGEEPEFDVWVRGHLNVAGQPKITITGDTTAAEDMAASIVDRYWHHVFYVGTTDISAWLIKQAAVCDALSLRDTGGVYFIPRHAIDEWRRRADALHEQTACRVYMIPAMRTEEALDAVLQSMIDECEAFAAAFDQEIAAGELGKRALEERAERAKTFLAKLARYEKLLGGAAEGKLDAIRASIEAQQVAAITAALTMEEGK